MAILIETAKAVDANSYLTVVLADTILGKRLYTTGWDAAGGSTALNYKVNDPGAALIVGNTSIPIDGGTGSFAVGTTFKFTGHATEYEVVAPLAVAGSLKITPGLTAIPADNEDVERLSAGDKEKALIWATRLFDNMMIWFGVKRTENQALRWPRASVVDPDGFFYDFDTIPQLLEEATADYALDLLEKNKFKLPSILGQGLESAQLGPLKVKVDKTQKEAAIPGNILSLLSPLGSLETEAQTGTRIIPLRRV